MSNRTNDIMKSAHDRHGDVLPMSFIVGFFGMNFFGENARFHHAAAQDLALLGSSVAIMAISPCFIWIYARRQETGFDARRSRSVALR